MQQPRKTKRMFMLILMALLSVAPLAQPARAQQAAQKNVTLNLKSVNVKDFFNEVTKQTGLNFICKSDLANQLPRVTVQEKNTPVRQMLAKVFAQLGCNYEIEGNFVTVTRKQTGGLNRPLSGTVRDASGEPLIGVTVALANSNVRTITDNDGHYQLNIPATACEVEFSYIGTESYTLQVAGGNSALRRNVTLESDNLLDEVVVTGYQTISKERTTGSFDKINAKDLETRPTADLSSALQGMVAGMQATENEDGTVTFAIRGQSTLYADAQPLIVVDGFPIEGTFTSINPNDVESVTILKDAAAASIWGARSANGVIVITTKKSHDKKLKVQGKAFWRIQTNPDLDYVLNQASSKSTVDYEIKGNEMGWDMGYAYTPTLSNFYGGALSQAQELYFKHKYFGLSESAMNAGLDELRNRSNRQQLKDYLMQTALLQQYNVNLQGGSEKLSNYLSLMYEKNDERTIKRGYNRFMLNYNNEYKFNKYITATVGATLQKRSQDQTGVTLQEFTELSPYDMIKNADGSYAYQPYIYDNLMIDQVDTSSFPYSDFSYNMLREVENRKYKTTTSNYRVQLGLNFKIIKGLNYDIKYQYERNEYTTTQYDNEETFFVRDRVNFYSDFNTQTGAATKSYLPAGGIKRSRNGVNFNDVFRNQLNYSNIFGKHDITAIAGIEMSRYVNRSTTNPTVYGYVATTNTAQIPGYGQNDNIGNLYDYSYYNTDYFNSLATTYTDREDRYLSYYGNVGYMFDERYGASFSIRSDGSNFVSKDASLRWSPMWSAGVKWNVHKEGFMRDASWVNRLSLRATYGINGNAEKTTSPETLIYTYTNSTIHGTAGYVVNYGNPLLKWERTKTFNVGADFSLFNNVLSGKIDYYNRFSVDVIGNVTVPSAYGTSTQRFNNAEISNKGVEMELTGNFKVNPIGLGIRSTITYAYNKNKIEKLYNPSLYCYQLVDPSTFVEGKPIGTIYSYEFAGTEDGIPYVYGLNGEKSTINDLQLHNRELGLNVLSYSGTTVPPHTLGWNTQLSWNGLQLSFFITGKFGGVFRAPFYAPPVVGSSKTFISAQIDLYGESDGTLYPTWPNKDEIWMYRWDRYIPNLSYFVENADFIKLKEVDLSWNLPKKWLRAINLQGASLFVQARDLGLIWAANKYDYDPEWLPGTNKPSASITFGANINF